MPKKTKQTPKGTNTKPKFPYTTTIGALRKILEEIPKRPKPSAFNFALINTWGIKDNNARTVFGVIKAIGLIDNGDNPTSHYVDYMKNDTGAVSLGNRIKETNSQLFQTSHEPHRESQENLRNFFNIHSGGSQAIINLQIQTFKTLSEFADFSGQGTSSQQASNPSAASASQSPSGNSTNGPTISINLHIHLPETKSRADYEEIIKDIAKYIYQK
jgi:hypothetical protein